MELFVRTMSLQLQLLTVMIVGFLIKKKKIINSNQQKGLSELLINVVLPANIIKSFLSDIKITSELFYNCIMMILICTGIQLFSILVFPFFFKKFDEKKSHVMTYGMIVSNSSFIGIPVVEYLFGPLAVVYTSVFQIPIRISMWTAGLSLFTKSMKFSDTFNKVIRHPCIIAVGIGVLMMALRIKLPEILGGALSILSGATTCLSMLIIGMILAEIKNNDFFDFSTLFYSFIRLIGFPVLIKVVLDLFQVNDLLLKISVLMSAMPCGSTCAILAQKYEYDDIFAAKIIFVSSLASVITVPIVALLIN